MPVSPSPLSAPLPSASARDELGRTGVVLHLLMPTMVFFQFIYSLSFNQLPDDVRLAFAGVLSIGHGFLALYALLRHGRFGSFLILVAAAAMVTAWSVGIVFLGGQFDLKVMSRDVTPHLAAIWMLTLAFAIPRRFLGFLSVISLAIGGILAFTLDPIEVGFIKRLGPFVGGVDGLHTSAYFILVNMFLVDQLRRQRIVMPLIAWSALAFGIVVLAGYQVRTTWVMLVVYIVALVYYRYRAYHVAKLIPLGIVGALILFAFGFVGMGEGDIALAGSGRIGNYLHRLDMLSLREPISFVFGSGPGSDQFTNSVYWWAPKGAHNDFLAVLIEQGFFGLGGFLLFLVGINRLVPADGKGIIWAAVVASLISNGALARPTVAVFLFMAMAVSAWAVYRTPSSPRR